MLFVLEQILEEALMVLLIHQGGVPERIHGDLSRVPPFICTALVHVLREDIIREVKKVVLRYRCLEREK